MRRCYGIDIMTPGVMDRFTAPDENILVETLSRIFTSFGWTKDIALPFKIHGPWCQIDEHPEMYSVDNMYEWLANNTTGHWYSYFENKIPYSRKVVNYARVTIFFESANEAMLTKLCLNLNLKNY